MLQLEKVTVIDASFRLHILKERFSVECMECVNKAAYRRKKKKKYDTFCTSLGKDDQITIPVSNCLIANMHEFHGFSSDLI